MMAPVRRAGRIAAAVLLLAAGTRGARGDDSKKKPGLFDFDHWKAPVTRERDAAKRLEPGQLDLSPAPDRPAELRAIKLRVYADRDYRNIVLRWQSRMRTQIQRVNGVVAPVFGVRFEIESLRDWDASHAGMQLEPILKELEALDPAREVDWVVGLATPLQGVARSIHQVGMSRLLVRHFVLRGMDDEQEIRALERELALISPEERGSLYAARKAHKEIVIFLHEWGHTMGLLHNEDPTVVMNPAYDNRQAAFSDFELRVISLVLDRRLTHRSEPYPESADLLPVMQRAPASEGADRERAELVAFLRQRAGARADQAAQADGQIGQGGGEALHLSQHDVDEVNRAIHAGNAGHGEEAWAILAPVIQRASAGSGADAATRLRLAKLAAHFGALSASEQVLSRTKEEDATADEKVKLAGEIETTRRRVALPSASLPADREPAYVAAFRETGEALESSHPREARARVEAFEAAFPGTPGADVLACDLALRSGHVAEARRRCEAALAKFGEATHALVLGGLIAARTRRDADAEKQLRRAIALDPQEPFAWQALAGIYRASGARTRLDELERQHRALFSSPLPK
jgi:hypothetical protein